MGTLHQFPKYPALAKFSRKFGIALDGAKAKAAPAVKSAGSTAALIAPYAALGAGGSALTEPFAADLNKREPEYAKAALYGGGATAAGILGAGALAKFVLSRSLKRK